jgi:glycosyltransferase involved in cell wall biosynthesis
MTSSSPQITVLMPVYNGSEYLKQSIEGILTQTYRDFEFLIIDDSSQDNSWSIIKEYQSMDNRIQAIRNDINLGLTKTLNKGMLLAQGKYIARQDHDDISLPERLEKEITFLNAHENVVLVGTHCHYIDHTGKRFSSWTPPVDDASIKKELLKGSAFCHGSVLFRKSLLKTVGFYREQIKYAEDYDYWLRISEKHAVANLNEKLYELRRGIPTVSSKNLDNQINNHLFVQELSKERRKTGQDSLEILNIDNIEKALITHYGFTIQQIRNFKEKYMFKFYYMALQTKKPKILIENWWQIFKLKPEKWKIRKLFNDLFCIIRNKP